MIISLMLLLQKNSYTFLDISSHQKRLRLKSNDIIPLMIELTPGVHEVQLSDVEHIQLKRRKIGNVRYQEYTNPSGEVV